MNSGTKLIRNSTQEVFTFMGLTTAIVDLYNPDQPGVLLLNENNTVYHATMAYVIGEYKRYDPFEGQIDKLLLRSTDFNPDTP